MNENQMTKKHQALKQSPSPPNLGNTRIKIVKASPPPPIGIRVGKLIDKQSDSDPEPDDRASESVTTESLQDKGSYDGTLPPGRKRITKKKSHDSNEIVEYQA